VSRVKDWFFKPFDRHRDTSYLRVDPVIASHLGTAPRLATTPEHRRRKQLYADGGRVRKVDINNGYWGGLMPRDVSVIDKTFEIAFDWANLLTGPLTVLRERVPSGRAWHIDNFYFYARVVAGINNNILLGPAALIDLLGFKVYTSSSQLSYDTWGDNVPIGFPRATFPFLNDRIGPREAKFGVTLFEGEIIRASTQLKQATVPVPAIEAIGFRFGGVEGSKATIEDMLSLKEWESH
jgi:hypothetical protein